MSEKNIGSVLVMDDERLVGIFSERDYARKGILQGRKAKSTPVAEVMTSEVITVSPEMSIEDCMRLFNDKRIRHLPVVEGGRVIGLLSIGDIVHAIIREQSVHIQFLEQYISNLFSLPFGARGLEQHFLTLITYGHGLTYRGSLHYRLHVHCLGASAEDRQIRLGFTYGGIVLVGPVVWYRADADLQ